MAGKIIIILIFLLSSLLISAQDTIYVNMQRAVELAIENTIFTPVIDKNYIDASNIQQFPIEINYEYGKLYSPETGWKLEVNQEFGTFRNKKGIANLNQALKDYKENYNHLQKRNLEIAVKTTYFDWLYYTNLLTQLGTRKEYISKSISVAQIKEELGETESVSTLQTIMKASELETEYTECQYNIDIAENTLKKLINTRKDILLQPGNLELYMVQKEDDTSAYNGSLVTDIIIDKHNIMLAETELKKSHLFPQFNAGIFYQNIATYDKMAGFKAGVKIPLWNKYIKNEINADRIKSEEELKYYNNMLWKTEKDIENIILKLDQIFIKIRHFQNHAIPTANKLLSATIVKYQKEDIEFEEYFDLINTALDIKQEYLELIHQYNKTALQLEMYVN